MWRLASKIAVATGGLVMAMPSRGFANQGSEDRVCIEEMKTDDAGFFGIYTEKCWPQIASYLQRRFYPVFSSYYAQATGTPKDRVRRSLLQTFDSIEGTIVEAARKPVSFGFSQPVYAGSTAVIAVVSPSFYVAANLGDSEIYLFSEDSEGKLGWKSLCGLHSVADKNEMKRFKSEHPNEPGLLVNEAIKGRVQVTRAFGLLDLKAAEFDNPQGLGEDLGFLPSKGAFTKPYVTHTPDIVCGDIGPKDKYLVLGSQGFWDKVALMGVPRMLLEGPEEAAKQLISWAGLLAQEGADSLSVVVIELHPKTKASS